MAACILPVWIATGIHAYTSYQSQRALLVENTLGTARALALVVDRELSNIQAALRALATSPAFVSGDFATVHGQALELLKSFPDSDVIVADRSGQQVVNSYLPLGSPLPKRSARQAVQNIFNEGTPRISDLFFGAVTKRPLLSLDVPVRVGDAVRYDLAITIPADHLGRIVLEQNLPQHWTGSIIDGAGTVVARTLDAAGVVGRPAGEELRRTVAAAREGTFEERTPDGRLLVSAFNGSAVSNWYAVVSVPLALLESELRHWAWSALAGALLSTLAAVALAALIARRIVHANARLAVAKQETEDLLREAEATSRSKSEFLAGLSHELRTPLNAINGFSELGKLQTFGPLAPKYKEYFEDIHHSGQLLRQLVDDLMDLSIVEAGKLVLDEEEFDLCETVRLCVNLLRARAKQGGIRLEVELPAALSVRADKRRTKQIVINLLSNAVKFTAEGGRVALSAGIEAAGGAFVGVADTGVGMDKETIAKAMTPFGVAGQNRRRKSESVGLGLSVTRSLVELHGGSLEIVSRLGEGTVATVHLPAARVIANSPDCVSPEAEPGR